MEWGIINRENWEGKSTFDVPIKRWDPLSTVKITSKDFGLRKERIRYYGHYSYISPIRGIRPKGFKTEGGRKRNSMTVQTRVMKKAFGCIFFSYRGKTSLQWLGECRLETVLQL